MNPSNIPAEKTNEMTPDGQEMVSIPAALHAQYVRLAALCSTLVNHGPHWVTATDGEESREFDPMKETVAFERFIKRHPQAQTTFSYLLAGDQVRKLVSACHGVACLAEPGAEGLTEDSLDLVDGPQIAGQDGDEGQREQGEQDDIDQIDPAERLEHNRQLQESSNESLLGCIECGEPAPLRKMELSAVTLAHSPELMRPQIESAQVESLVCHRCGHVEVTPWSIATRREAYNKLIASRLLLGQHIAPQDLYTTLGELYEQLLYSGALMLEMLQEIAQLVHPLGESTFDDDGVFTGHFVRDGNDEWEREVYDQLESLGMLRNLGGVLYQPVTMKGQPYNPYAVPMIDAVIGGPKH